MADNFVANPGTGGDTFAADDVGGVKYPYSKLDFGGDGATRPVTASDGLPVNTGVTAATTVPDNTSAGLPVRFIGQDITVARFADVGSSLLSPQMTMVGTAGTGQGVTQAAGSLLLTSGTTANASTLIRSINAWRGAWRMNVSTVLSQRIAQNNFAVVMADLIGENLAITINSSTSISVTVPAHGFTSTNATQFVFVSSYGLAGCPDGRYAIASIPDANTINITVAGWPASGSTTGCLFGRHHAKLLYSGTTATAALWGTQASGFANADATLAVNTTASPGHIATIDQEGRRMFVSDVLRASSATPNHTNRGSSEENIPDDNVDLYLFLWMYNGTSAPASTTTWTVGFWSVEKYANTPVFIQGVAPQGASAPLPVIFPSAQAVSGSLTSAGTTTNTPVTPTTNILNSAATTNGTVVKASAGTIYAGVISNNAATDAFFKLHNSTTVTAGSTAVAQWLKVPATSSVQIDCGATGMRMSTGICYSITGAIGDTDTTAVAAGQVKVALTYI